MSLVATLPCCEIPGTYQTQTGQRGYPRRPIFVKWPACHARKHTSESFTRYMVYVAEHTHAQTMHEPHHGCCMLKFPLSAARRAAYTGIMKFSCVQGVRECCREAWRSVVGQRLTICRRHQLGHGRTFPGDWRLTQPLSQQDVARSISVCD